MGKVKEIANAMKDINLLSSYDLDKERILAYADKLYFLFPDLKANHVNSLMYDFFLNKIEYTPSRGIRNFTENLPKIISSENMREFIKKECND